MRQGVKFSGHSLTVVDRKGTFSLYCQSCGKKLRVTGGRLNDSATIPVTAKEWRQASSVERKEIKKYLFGEIIESDCGR